MTNTNTSSPYHYINVDVIITETPHAEASIYRRHIVQHEVCTTGIMLFNKAKGGVQYPVRFVHDRTIASATALRSGDKIRVEMGRFKKRHGRGETEFIVKKFFPLSTNWPPSTRRQPRGFTKVAHKGFESTSST